MDPTSERRLAEIHPALASKVREMHARLAAEGIDFRVTQGLRTYAEQTALYNQVPRVTKARAGFSWHNFGLAVDVVADDITQAGFQCDWNVNHPAWKRIVAVGESLGLVAGAEFRAFPDWPHFQLTGRFPVTPSGEVRQIYAKGGIAGVWKESGIA